MPGPHRDGDERTCGATTVVQGQSTVYINGRLWAVEGDPNTHGGGELINNGSNIYIEGKEAILHTLNSASSDNADHSNPKTAEGSDDVYAFDN